MAGEQHGRRLLVLGATGGTGQWAVRDGLALGWRVTALVRDRTRAGARLGPGEGALTLAEGSIEDAAGMQELFSQGFDGVVSCLGITLKAPGDPLTRGTINIIAAMQRHGPRRLVVVSSLGASESAGQGSWFVRQFQKRMLVHTLADKTAQERAIRESGLDWTLIRPARLTNEATPGQPRLWTGPQPAGRIRWAVSRRDVADFALRALDAPETISTAFNMAS